MANCYGSKEYNDYIKEYSYGFTFSEDKDDIYGNGIIKYNGYILTYKVYTAEMTIKGIIHIREKTRFTVSDTNGVIYSCECIDAFMTPCFFDDNGIIYLFFRKTLYGYTLLNLYDLSEVNYFPSRVLQKGKDFEEAFIITDAKYYKNTLFLNGCYWASIDDIFIMELKTFNVYSVKTAFNITDTDLNSFTDEENIRFESSETKNRLLFTYDECLKIIGTGNPCDL